MSHQPTEQTIEPADADPPESDPTPQATRVAFYVLAVVLTAGDAMLVRLGTDGFWLMEAALFPLAFLLCLAGPNGPLRMGLAMIAGMILGWIIINPIAAFAMLFIGIFIVLANAALIFTGALLGSLTRKAVADRPRAVGSPVSEDAMTENQPD